MEIRYVENGITAQALAEFRNMAGWGHTTADQAARALLHTPFSVAALEGDTTVGLGRLVGDGALIWYVQDIIVLPTYRNHGIASAMIQKLLDFVENQRGEKSVTVGLMAAAGKEPFYEKFGFHVRPNDREGAGMVLRLGDRR